MRRLRPRRAAAAHETFAGLAGIGDLTATIMAPGSRNRRAGELLGQGTPADQIPAIIGQASEGLDSVPLIAETVRKAGIEAPGAGGPLAPDRRRDLARASGWPGCGAPSERAGRHEPPDRRAA